MSQDPIPVVSLRGRIIANYLAQAVVAGSNVLAVPVFWQLLGAEGYGLISLFSMMQSWLQLLDMGLSQTLAREAARYRVSALDGSIFRSLIGVAERAFWSLAVAVVVAILAAAGWLSHEWLTTTTLPGETVSFCIGVMGAVAATRWVGTIYRSILQGLEQQVRLAVFTGLSAVLRTGGVIAVLSVAGATVELFFASQLILSLVELLVLFFWAHVTVSGQWSVRWTQLRELRGVVGFSASVAFSSVVWVLLSQADKFVLSKLMTLSEFGAFSLSVVVAGVVHMVSAPLGQVVLPRLTALYSAGDETTFVVLYRRATRLVSLVLFPVGISMLVGAKTVLFVWSGDIGLAERGELVLRCYVLGNVFLAFSSFQYFLQYAKGDLRLNVVANALFLVVFFPMIVALVFRFGVLGAGAGWLAQALFFFLVWSFVVHRRSHVIPHWRWLLVDIGVPFGVSAVEVLILESIGWSGFALVDEGRPWLGVRLVASGCLVLFGVVGLLEGRGIQRRLSVWLTQFRGRPT